MKRPAKMVVANWKMNPATSVAALRLFKATVSAARLARGVIAVICPPHVYLSAIKRFYRGRSVVLGAQDVSGHEGGAHTGEVSVSMLEDLGVRYVIVGHSERRASGEDDALVKSKVTAVTNAGLRAIVCVGEKERDHNGEHFLYVRNQLTHALENLDNKTIARAVVAYEPLWAIGKTAVDAAPPEAMHEMSIYLRKVLTEKYGRDIAESVPILYGGSVEATNARELMERSGIQGFLVGHASLDPVAFSAIIKAVYG